MITIQDAPGMARGVFFFETDVVAAGRVRIGNGVQLMTDWRLELVESTQLHKFSA